MYIDYFVRGGPLYEARLFFKCFGCFPTNLEVSEPEAQGYRIQGTKSIFKKNCHSTVNTSRIRYVSEGKFALQAKCNIAFYGLQAVVCLFRLLASIWILESSTKTVITITCWTASVTSGFVFALKSLKDGSRLCDIISKAFLIEQKIASKSDYHLIHILMHLKVNH
jgi:hypothetical protein